MKYFLSSSPCQQVEGVWQMDPANNFAEDFVKALKKPCRALFVASSPDDVERTERHTFEMKGSFERSGIVFSEYILLDRRNQEKAQELVAQADLMVLAGGHVPTQNDFFKDISLRELMKGFDGVVLGISAGTMNSADLVYVHPELEGETKFTDEERYRPGLGLTKTMVLPHYQMIKNDVLDGLRLFEDVAYGDSAKSGYSFYCLVDGSYLYGHDGVEELRGEAYLIKDGRLERISRVGEVILTKTCQSSTEMLK